MNMNSYKTWALLGGAGGAGFGLFAGSLLYVLVNVSDGGSVAIMETVHFAAANGVAWGVLGLFAGVFLWVIFRVRRPADKT